MNLQKFSSGKQQVDAIFDSLIAQISGLLHTQSQVTVAVSGGKSPIPLLQKLSTANLDFTRIIFTLVDERIVTPTNNDSNENLVRTHLLQNNAKVATFINLVDLSLSPTEMALAVSKKVKELDIAILGMGEDGHTASIFPDCSELGSALDLNNWQKYIITTPFSAKYSRITLTLAALLKIPHLILSINGKTKLNILNEALLGNTLNYPVSYVLSHKPDTQIFWYE